MISDPLCIYDCDVPVDGSVAFVVSRAGSAGVDASQAVPLRGHGLGLGLRRQAATMMWSRTDLKPADVDIAQVYDGFTIYAIRWLEALGFCAAHESGAFVDGGRPHRARRRAARQHRAAVSSPAAACTATAGFYEACLQLRGEAGERQVAPRPRSRSSRAAPSTSLHRCCWALPR